MAGSDYSLNTTDVLDIVDAPCNTILFEDICNMDGISGIFPEFCFDDHGVGRCLLNYLYEDNYGHWVGLCINPSLTKDGKNCMEIEYFDPYGSFIDDIIGDFDARTKMEHNSDYPYLLKLLYSSGAEIYYNHFPLQSRKVGVNTCGRWTGFFLRYCGSVTVDEFGQSFMNVSKKYKVNRDQLITDLTNDVLNGEDHLEFDRE